jgi:hypothetical protein
MRFAKLVTVGFGQIDRGDLPWPGRSGATYKASFPDAERVERSGM